MKLHMHQNNNESPSFVEQERLKLEKRYEQKFFFVVVLLIYSVCFLAGFYGFGGLQKHGVIGSIGLAFVTGSILNGILFFIVVVGGRIQESSRF